MMAREGKITSVGGNEIEIKVDSVCVHGDNPGAVAALKEIRKALAENNITVVKALKVGD